MFKRLLPLALLLLASPAAAQNPTCPTRPPGDKTNACASTAFVNNNGAGFTPNLPLIGSSTGGIGQGTRSGNTTVYSTADTPLINGHCLQADSAGGIADAGAVCGSGGTGSGTVTSGLTNQFAYYPANGTTVSGLSFGNPLLGPNAVNVIYYGADPTGVSDSSTAFNSAVTACKTLGGATYPGCRIFIPSGQFLLNSTVTIIGGTISVECAGLSTLIVNGQTNAPAITFGDGTNYYFYNQMKNCAFAQASGVTAVGGNMGLNMLKQSNFYLEDIQTSTYPGALYVGISSTNSAENFWQGIGTTGSLNNGTQIFGAIDIHIRDSRSDANGADGYLFEGTSGAYVVSTTAYNNTVSGWQFYYPGTGVHNIDFFFTNVIGDTSGSHNWNISDLGESTLSNIWGSSQQSIAVNTGANGILLASSNVHDIAFIGGQTLYNNGDGVYIYNNSGMPTNVSFTGFTFGDTTHPNGRGGFGVGLGVDNAAAIINVIGGQSLGNPSGAIGIGALVTTNIIGLIGYSLIGISCTGAPTSSFSVQFGIVTHC